MTIVARAPDQDGIWRTKEVCAARPFDTLPQPVAAWWPGWQLFESYAGTMVTCMNADGSPSVTVGPGATSQAALAAVAAAGALQTQLALSFIDQSGNALPVSVPAADPTHAPKIFDNGTSRFAAELLALAPSFDPTVTERFLTRGDALGLAHDPALTIAWKMRVVGIGVVPTPTLLTLGNAVAPELNLFFQGPGGGAALQVVFSDSTESFGGSWSTPVLDDGDGWHSYILKKPAGTGYNPATWTLTQDSELCTLAPIGSGPLVLGNALTELGAFPGGGFPFAGDLGGMVVWNQVLNADHTSTLQSFLDAA